MARILTASPQAVGEAVAALCSDRIVVIPTCRWYMVCCKAAAREHIDQIFAAKKRPLSKQPLFVLPCKERVPEYFQLGTGTQQLIERLWPGELFLLLPWRDPGLAAQFSGFDPSAALVNSPPGLFGELALATDVPLAATTVNVSNLSDPSSPGPAISLDEVSIFLQNTQLDVEVVIDNGICPAFNHATIVDCRNSDETPRIVRQGYVHERAVKVALL